MTVLFDIYLFTVLFDIYFFVFKLMLKQDKICKKGTSLSALVLTATGGTFDSEDSVLDS